MRVLWILLAALWVMPPVMGCDDGGDGDGDADGDSDGDVDGDSDADADEVELRELEFVVYEADDEGAAGNPLAGAQVAVDTPTGRRDYETGDDGIVTVEVEADAEDFTVTVAREGFLPVFSLYRTTFDEYDEIAAADPDGEVAFVLSSVEGVTPEPTTTVTVSATGVPEDGWWCVSTGDFYEACQYIGNTRDVILPARAEPRAITAWVIDLTGPTFAPISWEWLDFTEAVLADTLEDQTLEVVFDGTPDITPVTVDLTIELPDDPDSVLDAGIMEGYSFPATVFVPVTREVRGGAVVDSVSADGRTMDVTVTYFPPAEGELGWFMSAWESDSDSDWYGSALSRRFFSTPIESGSYPIIDPPRHLSPRDREGALGARFETQELDGIALRLLSIMDNEQRTLWSVLTNHHSSVELPELPADYDNSVDWPPEGAVGRVRWQAYTQWLTEDESPEDDWLMDHSFAQSRTILIDLEGCRRRCDERECGDDRCGGFCGFCPAGDLCNDESGTCEECVPECGDRPCGDDGCGGICPPGCGDGEACSMSGEICVPEAGGWIRIEPATFMVGSPEDEIGHPFGDRELLHEVTLTRAYEILSTEVTQGDFETAMGYNPSTNTTCGSDCPVETVNWHEAAAYCNALSDAATLAQCYDCTGTGADVTCEAAAAHATPYDCPGYRMPTGAEWEQAARAGTTTATYNGDIESLYACDEFPTLDTIAWWCGNADSQSHPVAGLDPNGWGLFDVLGNVHEWCHDGTANYTADAVTDPVNEIDGVGAREIRGGTYQGGARGQGDQRIAVRANGRRSLVLAWLGLRPVRTLP